MASATWQPDDAARALAAWLRDAPDKRYVAYFAASQADKANLPTVNVLNRCFGGWRPARAAAEALVSGGDSPPLTARHTVAHPSHPLGMIWR